MKACRVDVMTDGIQTQTWGMAGAVRLRTAMDPGDVGTGAGRLADIVNTGFFFRISFSS